jgi:hypothetical protein
MALLIFITMFNWASKSMPIMMDSVIESPKTVLLFVFIINSSKDFDYFYIYQCPYMYILQTRVPAISISMVINDGS